MMKRLDSITNLMESVVLGGFQGFLMDREARDLVVHGVTKNQTRLSD